MKLEMHMIQNFPPACLNRDDTNSPKDCQFGGFRRARISSQCIKRAVRTYIADNELIAPENLAVRTNRLAEEAAKRLAAKGRDADTALGVASVALGGLGFGVDSGRTQYLIFIGESGVRKLTELCDQHWDALAPVAQKLREAEAEDNTTDARKAKKEAKDAVPRELQKELMAILDGTGTADLALFGRMLADIPQTNIDAACQVAHAISTNKAAMEMDFYTAVDDLKSSQEDAGAGMMGVIGYNSACFYRYAVIDHDKLVANLGGDTELARKAIEAFIRASAMALPTGKQNTFAAHSRPDLVMVACREKGTPLSLANAFTDPAAPSSGDDLTQTSVDKLARYWAAVTGVYGQTAQVQGPFYCGTTTPGEAPADWQDVGSIDALIDHAVEAFSGKAAT